MGVKEKKYHFIYKTTNLLNGKYYYGMHSTDNLKDGYMGSGIRISYSLNKYGRENHKQVIIEFCDSREELKKREKEIVNLNEISKENCMNLMVGGEGGFISDEQQKNRSLIANKVLNNKLKNDKEFKKKWLKNLKEGLQKAIEEGRVNTWKDNYSWVGKKHSEETKKKMSEKAKERVGEKNSQYGTCWITKNGENKKIKKEELLEYTTKGWIKGRDMFMGA